jgi:hypothetical protein
MFFAPDARNQSCGAACSGIANFVALKDDYFFAGIISCVIICDCATKYAATNNYSIRFF